MSVSGSSICEDSKSGCCSNLGNPQVNIELNGMARMIKALEWFRAFIYTELF
jgi:hypothetical protein